MKTALPLLLLPLLPLPQPPLLGPVMGHGQPSGGSPVSVVKPWMLFAHGAGYALAQIPTGAGGQVP